mgnify:FL=1
MIFSILTPTRNRPDKCQRFINSIKRSTKLHGRVELFFYVDSDDPSLETYVMTEAMYQEDFLRVKFLVGEPKSVSKSWNDIAKLSMGDYLIMGNDDLEYDTIGWDQKLEETLGRLKDPYYCSWVNDDINGARHCAFPIISREWYDTLGYFAPGIFNFGYNDTWVFDIAKRINRTNYIGDILVRHRHFTKDSNENDDTYARNRTQEKGNLYRIDKGIFENEEKTRDLHAKKIEAKIKEFHMKKLSATKIMYPDNHRYIHLNHLKPEWAATTHKLKEDPTEEMERKLRELYLSIGRVGMEYPILVAEDKRILRGNQRFYFAKDHGYDAISCYVIKDGDIDKWIQRTYIDENDWA